MAKSFNRVTLIGNLGHDPELRSTPQGQNVATLNIATTESFKDKSGEWKESTDWHRVILWNRLADIAKDYLKKGSKVYIEGKLKSRSYEDKDGVTRYITEVLALSMILLTPKDSSSSTTESPKYEESNPTAYVSESNVEYNAEGVPPEDEVPF